MPEPELQYPCPTCLGVLMAKLRLGRSDEPLIIDHCRRCGGIWLQAGEVQQLRRLPADTLGEFVTRGAPSAAPLCHACHVPLPRDAAACEGCGAANTLDCPQCEAAMSTEEHEGVRLDVCRSCRGVWFDHHELSAIWRFELEAAVRRHNAEASDSRSSLTVLDVLVWTDAAEAAAVGLHAGGAAVEAAAGLAAPGAHLTAETAAAAAETAAAAAEVAGEAAAGVFEAVFGIIGGIFS